MILVFYLGSTTGSLPSRLVWGLSDSGFALFLFSTASHQGEDSNEKITLHRVMGIKNSQPNRDPTEAVNIVVVFN